ncbi:2-hydroxychromene-2-carboxylate isomerase [Bradyrhizobium erythrophlei]|uniref:2-hydroxychromene-2-carboxylate isomerase n=1 Tax=Bradyrhizobium erythrophlei TaxID=1437360 RepID=UPI0035E5BE43
MSVEFIYDYRSPFSYLADSQLKFLNAPVVRTLIDVVAVMKEVNNQPSTVCPPKARYGAIDAGRWAKLYGVPFSPNRALLQAMGSGALEGAILVKAALAAREIGIFDELHPLLYRAIWASGADIQNEAGLKTFIAENGIDADQLWSCATSKPIAERLAESGEAAAKKGVFGVPTFFVDGEMFFGNDRLDFVRAKLNGAPVERATA